MSRIKIIVVSIVCLVLINSISLSAGETNEATSKDQKTPEILLKIISVNIDKVSFEEALKIVAQKGNFKLNYNRTRIPVDKIVSVKMTNVKVLEVLNFITEITNTEFKIISDNEIAIIKSKNQKLKMGKIRGLVLDKYTQSPLVGANVTITKTTIGSATNEEGWFSLNEVPVGSYTIQFDYIGYQGVIKTDIIVRSNRTTFLEAELKETILQGEVITVTAGYFTETEEQPVSSSNYSAEEIRRAATIGGDISRILNGLPSLSNENESNQIIVRGGSPAENSFYVDNMRMENINHFPFPGTSGGLVSLLNIDFIKDIDMYSGGFTSAYGNALSSVMNIEYREGNRDEFDMQFDLNFGGIDIGCEGPIQNGKGSYLFSARHSFTDILFAIVGENDEPVIYDDIQAKVVYDLSPNHKLSLLNLFSDDRWDILKSTAQEDSKNWYGYMKFRQNNFGLNWQYLWGKSGYSQTSVSHSYKKNNLDLDKTKDDTKLGYVKTKDNIFRLRNINFFNFSTRHNFNFGFEADYFRHHFNDFFDVSFDYLGNPTPKMITNKKVNHAQFGMFSNFTFNFTSKLSLTSGLRLDYYSYNTKANVSPRFSAKYQFSEKTSLSASTGIYYQQLPMYFLSQRDEFKNLNIPRSYHYVIGFNQLLTPNTRLSIELYDKEYENMPYNPLQPQLFIMDEVIYNFYYSKHHQLVDKGKAYTRGIEMMIQKKLASKFYGLISGTVFRSRYKDLNDKWRNRVTDNKYLLSIEGGYKQDHKWEFSIRYTLAGGIPYSLFDQQKSLNLRSGVYDTDHIMTQRLKKFTNLNIRLDRRFHFNKSNLIFYLSIWNVLNTENVSYYNWSENEDTAANYKQWYRLPVFGLEFEL